MDSYKNSQQVEEHIANIEKLKATISDKEKLEEAIIEARYAFIDKIVEQVVVKENVGNNLTEKIDKILANGFMALPILVLMLYLVFQITFTWIGQPIADELDVLINEDFYGWADEALTGLGVADWLHSLVCDGIIAGVGGVLTFCATYFSRLFFLFEFLRRYRIYGSCSFRHGPNYASCWILVVKLDAYYLWFRLCCSRYYGS